MTETAEQPTAPTPTSEAPRRGRPYRVYQALAWVGIVAGVVFIVAVVFFSGFVLGRHSSPGYGHFGSHQGRGVHFFHRPGLPPMAPQFGPGAPGNTTTPSSPTAVPPPRP